MPTEIVKQILMKMPLLQRADLEEEGSEDAKHYWISKRCKRVNMV